MMSLIGKRFLLSFGLLCAGLAGCATPPATPAPAAAPEVPRQVSNAGWEQDMQRFEAADRLQPPPRHAVLFIGSSSIRFWTSLAADFPGTEVINRGFGGSELRDSTWYADRIVVPYQPRQIVLYAGDNDLNSGRTPQQLLADLREFVQKVRHDLPDVAIAYIATKPSPSRAGLLETQRVANGLIRDAAPAMGVEYIDIFTPMLDADGQPRRELFIEDQLHMNAEGYALWRQVVAPYLKQGGPK